VCIYVYLYIYVYIPIYIEIYKYICIHKYICIERVRESESDTMRERAQESARESECVSEWRNAHLTCLSVDAC